MCGFTAIIDPYNSINPMQRETWVRAMAEPLSYRGRDDEQFFVSPDKHVSGLFRRLPVQGVGKAGAQPMSENNYTLFFNGEIYNYIELKQELRDQFKCNFNSQSDAEVLLKAFIHWGIEQTLSKLDGMFAILLCDHKNKKHYIINDIYGEKPLFYKYKDDILYVSSSAQSFKVLPEIMLDQKAVIQYLTYGFAPKPISMFCDVESIKPCQIIIFDASKDRLKKETYKPSHTVHGANDKNLVQDFDDLFTNSLSMRLRSERNKGLFLSGGIDSGLILATAQAKLGETLPCYTLSFQSRNDEYDESLQARALAKRFDAPHYVLPMNDKDLARIIPKKLGTLDQPIADAAYFPLAALTDFAAKDCVVMLGGEGSDELQAGYSRHVQEKRVQRLWAQRSWLKYMWPYLKTASHLGAFFGQSQLSRKFDKIQHLLNNDAPSAYLAMMQLWSLGAQDVEISNDFRQSDIDFFLPNQLLPKFDNATMQATIEGRTPYLSKPLFDFMDQTPRAQWENKQLSKQLLKKYDVTIGPKKGLTVPIASYLRGDLKEWGYDALNEFIKLNIMPAESIWRSWDQVQSGQTEYAQPIWAIIIFSAWQRAHNLSI